MTLFLLALVLIAAAVVAAPNVLEASRRPVDGPLRAKAPGDFAMLSRGATHYQWHGSRTDRILVLVPGLTTPSWVFDGLIRGLVALDYRVLTYDLYGRGHSDRAEGDQSLGFHTQQLGELLDVLGIREPVSLLGYSMGGAIATTFTAQESDRIDRLMLLAPAGLGQVDDPLLTRVAEGGRFGDWLWGLLGARHLRQAPKADPGGESALPDFRRRIASETRRKGTLAAVLSSARHALGEDLSDAHREIAAMYVPTLAIWGGEDECIALSSVGTLAKWNRQARQEVIDGAPHALVYTRTEEIVEVIRGFLRDVRD